jgi:hypothetical protein
MFFVYLDVSICFYDNIAVLVIIKTIYCIANNAKTLLSESQCLTVTASVSIYT